MIGETNILSFPGLGIGEFAVNEVAFTVFNRQIMWYGVIITLGIIAAFFYVLHRAKQEQITSDDVMDYAIFGVIFGVVGARLYYVLTKLDSFRGADWKETLYNVVAIWQGGLAIYGAIIAGAITILVVSKIKKIHVLRAFDAISPAVMIGQIMGRWGNFVNAEAFGGLTDLPWRMGIRNADYPDTIFVHPTFLYESLWNLVGFLIVNLIYKKKKYHGRIFLFYITWYGFGRMLIEGLRTDSLYVGNFRISQVVGFACFFVGLILQIALGIVNRGKKPILADVKTTFSDVAFDESEPEEESAETTEEPSEIPESVADETAEDAPAAEEKSPEETDAGTDTDSRA